MRTTPFLVLLLLLPVPSQAPAAPPAGEAPRWLPGESWQYIVSDAAGKPVNNFTVRVEDEREVRAGNSTVPAYNLTQRLTPYLPPARTNLPDETRWGQVYTVVETNLTVEKRSLCILSSEAVIRVVHYGIAATERETIRYSPSDGRLRFPLFAGTAWNTTFNRTRTHQFPLQLARENTTVERRCECQAYDTVPAEGYRVSVTDDTGGPATVFWWSPRHRAEVRREEFDPATGGARVYALLRHTQGTAPSVFSSPEAWLAIFFGATAAGLLGVGLYAGWRARHPRQERDTGSGGEGAPATAAPPPPPGGPPPGAPLARGPGRRI